MVESDPTKSPTSMSATAPPMIDSATVVTAGPERSGWTTAPSRTADTGATRVARNAGQSAARTVTKIPTTSETTIVLVAKTVPACGRSMPRWTKSALSPFASARPMKRPDTEASAPITPASTRTDACTCRLYAPSVRRVASSRVRCVTVIESVFAITKTPTNSATPANASRKSLKIERKPFVSFVACAACAADVRT